MDLSKSVKYRGLEINGATLQTGKVLRGITIESVNYSVVPAIGYTEKRAAGDGVHASDVFNAQRDVAMQGLIYATSAAELFDYLHVIRGVFSATSAYQQSPGDRGFLPLDFSQPTLDLQSFPSGLIDLQLLVRARAGASFVIHRDRLIGVSSKAQSIPWSVDLFAKDPRVYVNPEQEWDVAGGPYNGRVGTAVNRGDYETPLNIMLITGGTAPAVGEFHLLGLGVDMYIKIEAVANRVYRWFGDDRVLMVQDASSGSDSPFVLRMDLVRFTTKNRRPAVPASINAPSRPFSTEFQYGITTSVIGGSRLWWNEAFA